MNTIYEIVCKDTKITYRYIDYTTNFVMKKCFHKRNVCIGSKLLYKNIRENGGWDNWEMRVIEICDDDEIQNKIKQYITIQKHNCDKCGYSCTRLSDYERHCKSKRHTSKVNTNTIEKPDFTNIIKSILVSTQEIVKQNQELQNQIVELYNKPQQITQIVQQNTQNNSFNIQVFLNEKCGNAMNLSDFLKTLQVSNDDLVHNSQVGFVDGMAAIIIREMCEKLTVFERPVHCTDLKRDTVYYRENGEWLKDNGNIVEQEIMTQVSRDCLLTMIKWKKTNPAIKDMHSEFNLFCDKLPITIMAGSDRITLFPKTMKEVYKRCLIDKKLMK